MDRRIAIWVIIVAALRFIPWTIPAHAQEELEGIAIEFVIDNSGSIDDMDPADLRYAATRLILDVADDWDEIGVLCFSYEAQELLKLEPIGSDRSLKTGAITESRCTNKGGTFIAKGIDTALRSLTQSGSQRKYLILLIDGAPSGSFHV